MAIAACHTFSYEAVLRAAGPDRIGAIYEAEARLIDRPQTEPARAGPSPTLTVGHGCIRFNAKEPVGKLKRFLSKSPLPSSFSIDVGEPLDEMIFASDTLITSYDTAGRLCLSLVREGVLQWAIGNPISSRFSSCPLLFSEPLDAEAMGLDVTTSRGRMLLGSGEAITAGNFCVEVFWATEASVPARHIRAAVYRNTPELRATTIAFLAGGLRLSFE